MDALASSLEPALRAAFLEAVKALKTQATYNLDALLVAFQRGDITALEVALGVRDDVTWRPLVDAINQALDEVMLVEARSLTNTLGVTLNFDYTDPQAVAWAGRHAAELVTSITDDQRGALRAIATRMWTDGIPTKDAVALIQQHIGLAARQSTALQNYRVRLVAEGARDIQRLVEAYQAKLLQQRALTIARTETMFAANQGRLGGWRAAATNGLFDPATTQTRWVYTPGDRTCPLCRGMRNVAIPYGTQFDTPRGRMDAPPMHTMCIPAGAVVTGPRVLASTSRFYVGEMIELETRSGHRLSVTPNHPVLTPEGWVAAGLLNEGDNLISSAGHQGVVATIHPDNVQVPALIEEIAHTFAEPGCVMAVRVPVTAEDFHGDGRGSDVAVVRTNRLLERYGNTPFFQPHPQQTLAGSHVSLVSLPRSRVFYELLDGNLAPPGCPVCSGNVFQMLFGGSLLHHAPVRVGIAPNSNTMFSESTANGGTADAVLLTERLLRGSSEVGIDKVVNIRWYPFAGHVYNLETCEGWYSANGIITHNCRCTVRLVFGVRPGTG